MCFARNKRLTTTIKMPKCLSLTTTIKSYTNSWLKSTVKTSIYLSLITTIKTSMQLHFLTNHLIFEKKYIKGKKVLFFIHFFQISFGPIKTWKHISLYFISFSPLKNSKTYISLRFLYFLLLKTPESRLDDRLVHRVFQSSEESFALFLSKLGICLCVLNHANHAGPR